MAAPRPARGAPAGDAAHRRPATRAPDVPQNLVPHITRCRRTAGRESIRPDRDGRDRAACSTTSSAMPRFRTACVDCSDGCRCPSSRRRCSTARSSRTAGIRRACCSITSPRAPSARPRTTPTAMRSRRRRPTRWTAYAATSKSTSACSRARTPSWSHSSTPSGAKGRPTFSDQVAVALAAEEGEGDRAQVRALVRDKLAGLELPFQVRTFAETIWADYLTSLRKSGGVDGDAWRGSARHARRICCGASWSRSGRRKRRGSRR